MRREAEIEGDGPRQGGDVGFEARSELMDALDERPGGSIVRRDMGFVPCAHGADAFVFTTRGHPEARDVSLP